jgi:hypothetical protein
VTGRALRTYTALALSALGLAGAGAVARAYDTTPPGGTLSEQTPRLEFGGGGLLAPNLAGVCLLGAEDCDRYALDVSLPLDYAVTHPNARVRITVGWANESVDYDLYLVTRDGAPIDDSASIANPEVIEVPAPSGNAQWTIDIVGYLPLGEPYTATVELVAGGAGPADADGDGVLDAVDLCPTVVDPAQADRDGDGLGDACDP